jgi:hypothetical protein
MMEATTIGFLVGAFFLNRGHFDLLYHWLALVTSLLWVTRQQFRAAPATAAVAASVRGRITVRRRTATAPTFGPGLAPVPATRWR